jgi:hypothetical protein
MADKQAALEKWMKDMTFIATYEEWNSPNFGGLEKWKFQNLEFPN